MEKITLHTIAVLISHIYDHPLSDPICLVLPADQGALDHIWEPPPNTGLPQPHTGGPQPHIWEPQPHTWEPVPHKWEPKQHARAQKFKCQVRSPQLGCKTQVHSRERPFRRPVSSHLLRGICVKNLVKKLQFSSIKQCIQMKKV